MGNEVTIYALCEPVTEYIRYIGKANNLISRLRCHKWSAKSNNFHTRKDNWLRSINFEPVVKILEIVSFDNWEYAERFWIKELKEQGCDLTNYTDGGNISPLKGRKLSDERKNKLSQRNKKLGLKPPSRLGCKLTDEQKKKFSEIRIKLGTRPPMIGGWNKGIRKTHCKNGHEYSPENTRLYKKTKENRTYQICKICERDNMKRYLNKEA
jgi:hypothetical protein